MKSLQKAVAGTVLAAQHEWWRESFGSQHHWEILTPALNKSAAITRQVNPKYNKSHINRKSQPPFMWRHILIGDSQVLFFYLNWFYVLNLNRKRVISFFSAPK